MEVSGFIHQSFTKYYIFQIKNLLDDPWVFEVSLTICSREGDKSKRPMLSTTKSQKVNNFPLYALLSIQTLISPASEIHDPKKISFSLRSAFQKAKKRGIFREKQLQNSRVNNEARLNHVEGEKRTTRKNET